MNVVGYSDIYVICCHHGKSKPSDVNIFLHDFKIELKDILCNGLMVDNIVYSFQLRAFPCDAPARAFVLNIKGHAGYSSCHKCKIIGKREQNRSTFPGIKFNLRTSEEYKGKCDKEHHHDVEPNAIDFLNIDVPTVFVMDGMHVVYEGVMGHLLRLWFLEYKQDVVKLSFLQDQLYNQFPSEFSRRPRSFLYFKRFKTTETRQLLLYTLPIIGKGILKQKFFSHFLKFHCAIRILTCPQICIENNHCARKLLKEFVRDFRKLYGKHTASYNLHCLLHLADDVLNQQAPLDNFSCFKFENHMQFLKQP